MTLTLSQEEAACAVTAQEAEARGQRGHGRVTVLVNSQRHAPSQSQGALILRTRKRFLKMVYYA